MKLSFKVAEISFLKEALQWGKMSAIEKAEKYTSIDGYKESTLKPRIAMFDTVLAKVDAADKKRRIK